MLGNRLWAVVAVVAVVAAIGLASASPLIAQTAPAPTAVPDPSDAFFDDSVVHDIFLTVNSKDWQSLKDHFLENTYYPATFKWRDQTVRNVGIRSRGTGSRSGVKPGLRLDFDYYTSDQKFLGLKSFILRNNIQDPSNMHERVSMLFFRHMGIIAEREAHTRLYINNAYVGVYTLVESIDKTFLKKTFNEDGGHLYEFHFDNSGETLFNFGYQGADPAIYTPFPFKPETLETDPQGGVLERFVWTITEAGDAAWRSSMAEFLDLEKFIKHLAVENFLAEEDGITGDYGPNNFYFYRFVNSNLYTFLPWDKSNTFWESPNYSIFRNITDGADSRRNRLVLRTLQYTDLRELYLNTLLACADSAVAPAAATTTSAVTAADAPPGWMEAEVLKEYAQIQLPIALDTFKIGSNGDFEKAYNDMLLFARQRSDKVREQVAADRARRALRR